MRFVTCSLRNVLTFPAVLDRPCNSRYLTIISWKVFGNGLSHFPINLSQHSTSKTLSSNSFPKWTSTPIHSKTPVSGRSSYSIHVASGSRRLSNALPKLLLTFGPGLSSNVLHRTEIAKYLSHRQRATSRLQRHPSSVRSYRKSARTTGNELGRMLYGSPNASLEPIQWPHGRIFRPLVDQVQRVPRRRSRRGGRIKIGFARCRGSWLCTSRRTRVCNVDEVGPIIAFYRLSPPSCHDMLCGQRSIP